MATRLDNSRRFASILCVGRINFTDSNPVTTQLHIGFPIYISPPSLHSQPNRPNLSERFLTHFMPYSRGLCEQNDDDRLGLCTEFIGCESCEMGMDEAEVAAVAENGARWTGRRRERRRREKPRFPPPLPWLSDGRSKFMKGERRDGRLVLTEVTVDNPKVFSASRKDGRLKLDVIAPEEEEEEETEEWREPDWRSEGYRRCQEVAHRGPIPAWCHHRFVTTA